MSLAYKSLGQATGLGFIISIHEAHQENWPEVWSAEERMAPLNTRPGRASAVVYSPSGFRTEAERSLPSEKRLASGGSDPATSMDLSIMASTGSSASLEARDPDSGKICLPPGSFAAIILSVFLFFVTLPLVVVILGGWKKRAAKKSRASRASIVAESFSAVSEGSQDRPLSALSEQTVLSGGPRPPPRAFPTPVVRIHPASDPSIPRNLPSSALRIRPPPLPSDTSDRSTHNTLTIPAEVDSPPTESSPGSAVSFAQEAIPMSFRGRTPLQYQASKSSRSSRASAAVASSMIYGYFDRNAPEAPRRQS